MPKKKTEKKEKIGKIIKKVEEKVVKPEEKKKLTVKEEVEKKVIEMAKTGMTTEKIGLELKKQGIYAKKLTNKRIGEILKNYGISSNADIINLEKRVEKLKKHLSIHPHDYSTKRALLIKEANLNKLKKIAEKKR
ncbi:MAG: hypothetical protein QXO70_01710 [Candidatus Pacearchaeota archaeon]